GGLPDPVADDDQLLRDGRRQPAGPDLHQRAAARPAAARHGAAAAPDAAGGQRAGLLRPGADAGAPLDGTGQRRGRPGGGAGSMNATQLLLLAQATDRGIAGGATPGVGEGIAFWILGPVALAGALGMVFARNAV